jgi:dephospho-CoA kinase
LLQLSDFYFAMSKPPRPPLRLGLTGGMGCGKSTAAGIFRELGFGVTESDAIVRELWDNDPEVRAASLARWGNRVLASDGSQIDRRKVAEIVFAEPGELDWLESLLHPIVRSHWQASVAVQPEKDWVVEIPLLFEKNLASEFNFTLCIASSPTLQATRLAARGLSPLELAARQSRQWPLAKKIEQADLVAWNDGSVDFLRREIVHFVTQLNSSAP